MSDDGWAGLMVMHSCMVSLWCMVLWQARKTYSDSVDATGVSVSRAHNALNKLGLVESVYTCNRMTDALLCVTVRTKED